MAFISFFVEVKAVDCTVCHSSIPLFFWYYFGVQRQEVAHGRDEIIFTQLFVEFSTMGFVYPNILQSFLINIRFLLESDKKIMYSAGSGDKNVERLLVSSLARHVSLYIPPISIPLSIRPR